MAIDLWLYLEEDMAVPEKVWHCNQQKIPKTL